MAQMHSDSAVAAPLRCACSPRILQVLLLVYGEFSARLAVWCCGPTSQRPRGVGVVDFPLHGAYKVSAMMGEG
jgi:hypothetical protein